MGDQGRGWGNVYPKFKGCVNCNNECSEWGGIKGGGFRLLVCLESELGCLRGCVLGVHFKGTVVN